MCVKQYSIATGLIISALVLVASDAWAISVGPVVPEQTTAPNLVSSPDVTTIAPNPLITNVMNNGATVLGQWIVTATQTGPVTTGYTYGMPNLINLSSGQSYQTADLLSMSITGTPGITSANNPSGSYSISTYLAYLWQGTPTEVFNSAASLTQVSLSTGLLTNGSLNINNSVISAPFTVPADGSYYLVQNVTVAFDNVPAGDSYGIDLPDTSAIVPEPSTFVVWSILGALGIFVGWWRTRKAV